jgi:DNA-binding response OmpR family regulator
MAKILLAEDDVWMSRTIGVVLGRRGHEVEIAGNGEVAFALARERRPDLLLTDVMMPVVDGWSLVQRLHATPELAELPVIFMTALSSPDDRIRALRLGAYDCIIKPFRYEELDLRVAAALRRPTSPIEPPADEPAPEVGFHGRLSDLALSSVLILVDQEGKTGLISLRGEHGESAELLVRRGRVVQASLRGRPDIAGAACVHHTLRWRRGEFRFVAREIDAEDQIEMGTMQLLLEAARLQDEQCR